MKPMKTAAKTTPAVNQRRRRSRMRSLKVTGPPEGADRRPFLPSIIVSLSGLAQPEAGFRPLEPIRLDFKYEHVHNYNRRTGGGCHGKDPGAAGGTGPLRTRRRGVAGSPGLPLPGNPPSPRRRAPAPDPDLGGR